MNSQEKIDFYRNIAREIFENKGQDPYSEEHYKCQFRPDGKLPNGVDRDILMVLT